MANCHQVYGPIYIRIHIVLLKEHFLSNFEVSDTFIYGILENKFSVPEGEESE